MKKYQKNLKEIIRYRQEKLENIKKAGYNPYAYNFHKTHHIKDLIEKMSNFLFLGVRYQNVGVRKQKI